MQPGAIAIVQVCGDGDALDELIRTLTHTQPGRTGTMRLATFRNGDGEIDSGLIARISSSDAHLMPHGGPRVVQRLLSRLRELGTELQPADDQPPRLLYPEAHDDYEALMLAALHRARSPLAIDLLLEQPRRWRNQFPPPTEGGGQGVGVRAGSSRAADSHDDDRTRPHPHANPLSQRERESANTAPYFSDEDRARSRRLNRLIDPPLVVLAGPANVGKSTLSNTLLGRSMSIAVDQPGTTRDYTAGAIELLGLVVLWHDTPGLRRNTDAIEAEAIDMARQLMQQADFLIAMTDHEQPWPELPRCPDLRVAGKSDLGRRSDADHQLIATTGAGVPELVRHIRELLVPPADLEHPGPWLFDDRLLQGSA